MRITLKRVFLFTGLLVLLLAGLFVYQLLGSSGPITVSPQTTVITEPLADDGLPDYSAYLLAKMGDGVTPENNGAIPFLQAMWPTDMTPLQQRAVCDELGIDTPETDGMKEPYADESLIDDMIEWHTLKLNTAENDGAESEPLDKAALRHWVRDEFLAVYSRQPWTTDDTPAMAQWIERNERHFALLGEAADREKYYLPSPTLLTDPKASLVVMLLPQVQTLRSAVRCLVVRANFHIGSGDLDAAWQDCKTIYRLSETSSRQALVGELVSIACQSMADRVTIEVLNTQDLTLPLAEEIHTFLETRPPRENMGPTLDEFERLLFVTAVLEMSGQREPANRSMTNIGPAAILSSLATDWDLILEMGNDWYDNLAEALKPPTHAERQAAIDAVDAEINKRANLTPGAMAGSVFSRTARSKNIANVLSSLLLPAVSAATTAETRANIERQLLQTAAALAVYQLQNGEYPDSLEALAPDLMDSAPVDLYGNTLVYEKTSAGYLLYSLGENGQDDGGSNSQRSVYKGYELASTEAGDRAIRQLLGEPPAEADDDDIEYDWLVLPDSVDDYALRLPPPKVPLPKYEPPPEW